MELNREQIVRAFDILDKMDFFQGNRAERELWFCKPIEVQEQDITSFSQGVVFLKTLIRELIEENERLEDNLIKQCAENIMLLLDKNKIRADTVRKMQERLKSLLKTDYINGTREHALSVIDKIAKEMLEEK